MQKEAAGKTESSIDPNCIRSGFFGKSVNPTHVEEGEGRSFGRRALMVAGIGLLSLGAAGCSQQDTAPTEKREGVSSRPDVKNKVEDWKKRLDAAKKWPSKQLVPNGKGGYIPWEHLTPQQQQMRNDISREMEQPVQLGTESQALSGNNARLVQLYELEHRVNVEGRGEGVTDEHVRGMYAEISKLEKGVEGWQDLKQKALKNVLAKNYQKLYESETGVGERLSEDEAQRLTSVVTQYSDKLPTKDVLEVMSAVERQFQSPVK